MRSPCRPVRPTTHEKLVLVGDRPVVALGPVEVQRQHARRARCVARPEDEVVRRVAGCGRRSVVRGGPRRGVEPTECEGGAADEHEEEARQQAGAGHVDLGSRWGGVLASRAGSIRSLDGAGMRTCARPSFVASVARQLRPGIVMRPGSQFAPRWNESQWADGDCGRGPPRSTGRRIGAQRCDFVSEIAVDDLQSRPAFLIVASGVRFFGVRLITNSLLLVSQEISKSDSQSTQC